DEHAVTDLDLGDVRTDRADAGDTLEAAEGRERRANAVVAVDQQQVGGVDRAAEQVDGDLTAAGGGRGRQLDGTGDLLGDTKLGKLDGLHAGQNHATGARRLRLNRRERTIVHAGPAQSAMVRG